VLGTRQTGLMEFRIAELPAHSHLLDEVQAIANHIRKSHPELADPLIQRWTGSGQQFAKV
jgi:ATP-dependent DNA helicase RecG